MQYRTIPGTDLSVSLLGFGNFIYGTDWWGTFSDDDGVRLQNRAYDLGVNFFDTAAAYGDGRAEGLLRQTIEYAGRDNLVVSTKFGYDFYPQPDAAGANSTGDDRTRTHRERKQDFSPAFLRKDLEHSLKRLGIDCIDLYQAHNLKLPQFKDDLFEALESFRAEGKIRYWGVALGPAIGWREEGYDSFIKHRASVVQSVFNLYEQDPGREFCEIAGKLGAGGVIARVPTNSGMLDEEFTTPEHKFPEWDHRKYRDKNWLIYGLKKNELLRPIAEECGCSIRHLALRWLATWPAVVSIEPNILAEEDLSDSVRACDGTTLPGEVFDRIGKLYASDFSLGDEAHPCDWKSSIEPGGTVRSSYQPVAELTPA